ncbi:MAG: zinc ribbon domain-containing protein [Vicinamibacterales bacterium]|jgi:putative FmdB family regulatory protein|nr:zinc ribbon domain-containing protein [Vicinamibacterales bacterium]
MPLHEYSCVDCSARTEVLVRTASARPAVRCGKCGSNRVDRKPAGFAIARSELDRLRALDPKYKAMVDDEWSKTTYADPMKYVDKMIPFDAADDPGDPVDF